LEREDAHDQRARLTSLTVRREKTPFHPFMQMRLLEASLGELVGLEEMPLEAVAGIAMDLVAVDDRVGVLSADEDAAIGVVSAVGGDLAALDGDDVVVAERHAAPAEDGLTRGAGELEVLDRDELRGTQGDGAIAGGASQRARNELDTQKDIRDLTASLVPG
jgi:hypothetical protein